MTVWAHVWANSSGTTDVCKVCGVVLIKAWSSALPKSPWNEYIWMGPRGGKRMSKECPPCPPNKGAKR